MLEPWAAGARKCGTGADDTAPYPSSELASVKIARVMDDGHRGRPLPLLEETVKAAHHCKLLRAALSRTLTGSPAGTAVSRCGGSGGANEHH